VGTTGRVFFFSIPMSLWDTVVTVMCPWDSRAKAFSYNKRTMDRAMRPF
jgi:hypothetical protein